MRLTPFGLTAGPLMIMAEFRPNDALITRGKTFKAGEAVALIEAFLGLAPAGNTEDRSCEGKRDRFSQQTVDIDRALSNRQFITHRRI